MKTPKNFSLVETDTDVCGSTVIGSRNKGTTQWDENERW